MVLNLKLWVGDYMKYKFLIKTAVVMVLLIYASVAVSINAQANVRNVIGNSYETDKSYDFSKDNAIASDNALGKLNISGDINQTTTYNDVLAYGVNSGQVNISYEYDGTLLDENGETHIIDDSQKKLGKNSLGAKINKGVLIIQKSDDRVNWSSAANPIVNFFENNPSGINNFYTTSGKDLANGCYYRIIIAYKTKTVNGGIPLLGDEATYHVDVYEFFLCTNNCNIALHNLSADVSSVETEEYSAEILKKGESLTDNSVTVSGFSIDKLGTSNKVTVNGIPVGDGAEFTQNGRYMIYVKTLLGNDEYMTVYVFNGNNDKGKSVYFDDFIVDGKRVFRNESKLPVYAVGASINIKSVNSDTPALTGTIKNIDNGETITLKPNDRTRKNYKLEAGTYRAELFSGNTSSGTFFKYTFNFIVLSEDAKPYANWNTLTNRESLCDFSTEHYEVAYLTTRGGIIYVCFASYDEAFKYAYQIEKRYIEKSDDGIRYWLDKSNSNEKIKYDSETIEDKIKLTELINNNAEKNIEIAYFDPTDEFTYQTLDENKDFGEALESLSLEKSIRVFPNDEEKQKLLSRVPYIEKDYRFVHVDDYDTVSVAAKCMENGETYTLEYLKPIGEQLTVSSFYTITETNKYGDSISYDVCYMADNQTVAKLKTVSKGITSNIEVDYQNHNEIMADSVYFENIINKFDEHAIVKIKTNAYEYDLVCTVDKIKNLVLYKSGVYEITFTDRVKNTFTLTININGNVSYDDRNDVTYSEVYNNIHKNHHIEEDS